MAWIDRILSNITLTSPDGDVFQIKWRGDSRTKEKKLGIFDYPNSIGTKIQDLGIKGYKLDTILLFDGPNYDIDSQKFWNACDQTGSWKVTHPVKGKIELYLVSVSEPIEPINSGGLTEMNTSWIQPNTDKGLNSIEQLSSNIKTLINELNQISSGEYDLNTMFDSASEIIANESAINEIIDNTKNFLLDIINNTNKYVQEYQSTLSSINDTLSQDPFDPFTLAGQIGKLVSIPGKATDDISESFSGYTNFINSIYPIFPETPTQESINAISVFSISVISAIASICFVITNGEVQTRQESIQFIDKLNSMYSTAIEQFDDIQKLFDSNPITIKYISFSNSYVSLINLVQKTIEYLISQSLSLKTEKLITLKNDRSPIEITVSEYGSLGNNDENLDFLIMTNFLKSNEIRLLPAGKQVKIYV